MTAESKTEFKVQKLPTWLNVIVFALLVVHHLIINLFTITIQFIVPIFPAEKIKRYFQSTLFYNSHKLFLEIR